MKYVEEALRASDEQWTGSGYIEQASAGIERTTADIGWEAGALIRHRFASNEQQQASDGKRAY